MIQSFISGNITRDAVVREANGSSFVSFTIASNSRRKDNSGNTIEETTFINCTYPNADFAELFYKGRAIAANGFLKAKVWQDQPQLNLRITNFQVFGKSKEQPRKAQPNTAKVVPMATEPTSTDLPF